MAPPFATMLQWVVTGTPEDIAPTWCQELRAAVLEEAIVEKSKARPRVQAVVTSAINKLRFVGDFSVFMVMRFNDAFSPQPLMTISVAQAIIVELRKWPNRYAMAATKLLLNGMHTSDRMPEAVRHECMFGCGGVDAAAHYVWCPSLWSRIRFHFPAVFCDGYEPNKDISEYADPFYVVLLGHALVTAYDATKFSPFWEKWQFEDDFTALANFFYGHFDAAVWLALTLRRPPEALRWPRDVAQHAVAPVPSLFVMPPVSQHAVARAHMHPCVPHSAPVAPPHRAAPVAAPASVASAGG